MEQGNSGLRNLLPFDVEHCERILKEFRELIVASVLITLVVDTEGGR